jgi:hypothetical protein
MRRRRVVSGKNAKDSMEEALIECAKSMAHGNVAAIHELRCPVGRGGRCGCRIVLVGPAVRDALQ